MNLAGGVLGREPELQQLLPMLQGGQAVLVVGDAGIGKTRLAAELIQRLECSGRVGLITACLPLADHLPLLPIVDAVRELYGRDAGHLVRSALDGCPPFVREEVARLLPELGQVTPSGPGEGWQQQRLFAALARLLRVLESRCGLSIVIEDLHWSDRTTRDFLTYLLAHLADGGPSLLLTARSDEIGLANDVSGWLAGIGLSGLVTRITLSSLTVSDVAVLAETVLGSALSPPLVRELHLRTAGNAFFVEQLLATGSYGPSTRVSEELARLLRARAATVDLAARQVLSALAVAGRPLTEDELVHVTGQGLERVREGLRTLEAANLARRGGRAGFAPQHALMAEAVEEALLPGEAADLHGAVAAALGKRGDTTLAAETARHWAAAGRPADELPTRIKAAAYAETVYAFVEAAQHWGRALDLAETVDPAHAAEFALKGMIAWERAGDEALGMSLGQRGVRLAPGDQPQVEASLRARVAMLLFVDDPDEAISDLTAAARAFERLSPSPDEIHALTRLYHLHRARGAHRDGLPFLQRAVRLGPGQPAAVGDYVQALINLAYEEVLAGNMPAAGRSLSRAREATAEHPNPDALTALALAENDVRLKLNQLQEVVTLGGQDLQLIRSQGMALSYRGGLIAAIIVDALLCLGRVASAGSLIDPATDNQRVRADTRALHIQRSSADLARGELEQARTRIEEVLALGNGPGLETESYVSRIRAELALWTHEPATAVAIVQPTLAKLIGAAEDLAAGLLVLGMRGCADLAERGLARRDPATLDEAAGLSDSLTASLASMRADPFAEHQLFTTQPAEGADWQAEIGRCLRYPDNWNRYEAAAQEWDSRQRPHRAAYARWRQAEALLVNGGHRTQAEAALHAAWQQAEQHTPLRAEISTLAHMARIDLTRQTATETDLSSDARDESAPHNLTGRELDVLRLLVDGLTNAQIGARLYISPKTASVHVTAILRKLNATNRVHAAAIAQRTGIAGQ